MIVDGPDYEVLHGTTIIERVTKIDQIISEPGVKEIKPKSRKCLYDSEPQSEYFNVKINSHLIPSRNHKNFFTALYDKFV